MSWETSGALLVLHVLTPVTHTELSLITTGNATTQLSPSTCSSFFPTEIPRQLSTWPATVRTEATDEEECFHLAIDSFPFYREYKNLYSLLYAWQKKGRAVTGTHRRVSIREVSHPRAAVKLNKLHKTEKEKRERTEKGITSKLEGKTNRKKNPYLVKGDQKAQGCVSLQVRPEKIIQEREKK